jgi:hypothetical protein
MNLSLQGIIILATFLLSLAVYLQRPVSLYLKLFPFYFLCGFLLEGIMEYMAHHGRYNTGLANVWCILEFSFYFFVLREIIFNKAVRRILFVVAFIFILFSLIMLYTQKQVGFNAVNFSSGCLITVVFCIYYFVELFQESETQSLAALPAFWIATAILFTNVCTFPMYALISFMKELPAVISNNLANIYAIVSVLTSILYSIGFLCRIRIRKYTL